MPKPAGDRITVVDRVYYHPFMENARDYSHSYERNLLSTEMTPYEVSLVATEEWQPLQFGPFINISMMRIFNKEGTKSPRILTPEQQTELDRKVIEVGYKGDAHCLIPPGETSRYIPKDITKLFVRCQSGIAKFQLVTFPD